MIKRYCALSALLFAAVSLAHLARIVAGWTVVVGDVSIPMVLSWIGFLVPGALAIWGFAAAANG
ncbi:MAG: hypothetical protein QNJ40_00275 [Xanthomonadales bacterium]|nr:hypothetical protein [Xanthomonadales bacterium]